VICQSDAEQGDVTAQFNLGLSYDTGNLVPMDKEMAIIWYTKAAKQGHALSQGRLGHMYAGGEGVPQNFEYAIYWFKILAEQGDVTGQFSLAFTLEKVDSDGKNIELVMYWYRAAAVQGHKKAQERLTEILQTFQPPAHFYQKPAVKHKVSLGLMFIAVVLWIFFAVALLILAISGLSFGRIFWVLAWGGGAIFLTRKAKQK